MLETYAYQRIDDGKPTIADDPERGVWYSAGQSCGYWTDDWTKLVKVGPGIPVCPHCKMVGMQTTFKEWIDGAKKFEESGYPWYRKWLLETKEKCFRQLSILPMSFIDRYKAWCKEKGISC